ncbi:MAG: SDR family NAD(P)-dependent oxidoreductase [Sphingomonadales bacterium]|nr:SDR family NAD(P)-dependent oxidoreductase [Sphingomonadales bacterium]
MKDQPTAVVTGASAGIGKATARMLAQRGWHVIGTGRDPARCQAAEAEIRAAAAPGARVDFLKADFERMADVRRLAADILGLTDRLDVLINNAGGVRDAHYTTVDGTEATFAANHLAPFVLTRELLPLLKAGAAALPAGSVRVIAVSSSAHRMCQQGMDWDDLQSFKPDNPVTGYCMAKLANILFTHELARRVAADGIVAQVMHPGVVDSNFASHGDANMQSHMAAAQLDAPDKPAETLVWLATAPETGRDPGRYFFNLAEEAPTAAALDMAAAARLWTETEALLATIER